jgi:hypothetical protein
MLYIIYVYVYVCVCVCVCVCIYIFNAMLYICTHHATHKNPIEPIGIHAMLYIQATQLYTYT